MSFDDRLDRELLRGVLPLCALAVVAADGPTYGYAVAQSLADGGLGTVKGGTLYPLLQRLEDDGLVETTWGAGDRGPHRRYYAVTPAGRETLRRAAGRWSALAGAASALVTRGAGAPVPDPGPPPGTDPRPAEGATS